MSTAIVAILTMCMNYIRRELLMRDEQVGILIDAKIYNEFVIRRAKTNDVSGIIENVLEDFLERTKRDDMWSDEYLGKIHDEELDKTENLFGESNKGYFWQNVFLPNGTKIKFTYKRKDYYAQIIKQQFVYENKASSPSAFANQVANNTSRNAWHDIWVQFPNENRWQFSNDLRRNKIAKI